MAKITGYTAERMKEIEDGTVIDGNIIDGHLILTKFDGTEIDAGVVVGPQGPQGEVGSPNPSGTILTFAGPTPPAGYLLCNGQAVLRATYADLFAVIGGYYGNGDGSTTFNLPNLKGRIPIGLDAAQTEFASLAQAGGAKTHILTIPEMPAHQHSGTTSTDGEHSHSTIVDYPELQVKDNSPTLPIILGKTVTSDYGSTGSNGDHSHTMLTNNVGGGVPHNNLQPYLVINYIIKT